MIDSRTRLWVLPLAFAIFAWGAPLTLAQNTPLPAPTAAGPDYLGGDPTQDIFIEGIGFSKLTVVMELPDTASGDAAVKFTEGLLEKNLCWSGLFNIASGTSRFC